MGLFVDDEERLKEFLAEAQILCPVRVLDYNRAEKVYDNSIFYQSFVSGLVQLTGLPPEKRDCLLVNSNLVMQMLDEKGLSPF
ncbi:MAG: Zn-dependent hydrolase, partial [Firmicutes bacterium]|nr:Zn-dependent hydrolase [Bacillota bacterium]